MSDIVERLRKENSMPPYYGVPKIQADAADEIERLRAALRFYAGWPQGPAGNIAPLLLDAGRIARAALEGK